MMGAKAKKVMKDNYGMLRMAMEPAVIMVLTEIKSLWP